MHHACCRLTDHDATKSISALPGGKESKTRGCYVFVRVDVGHLIPGQKPPIATLTAVLIIPCVFAQCSFPERYPCQVLPTCIARSPVSARPTETIISARRSQQSGLSPPAMIAVRTDSPFIDGRSQDKIGILVICDGHGGSGITADYTASKLSKRLEDTVQHFVEDKLNGVVDRETMLSNADALSTALRRSAHHFDERIGKAVKKLCPEPETLTAEQSEALVKEHLNVIQRAYYGTTFVAAIVNVTIRCMWTVCIGDSTVGISTLSTDSRREWQRLCAMHRLTSPREYFSVAMKHWHQERDDLTKDDRILGYFPMTRAIGDYAVKLKPSYSDHLFNFLPGLKEDDKRPYPPSTSLKTPPYISARPSVSFLDLEPMWNADPVILLFSDGVDSAVKHYHHTQSERPVDPGPVIAKLLGR
ncbi:hypothetical protein C8Q70DRAFT_1094952 [Cubamyces menziesii]|nr:hypothetical protein C8Q70DRAFT_1094952 [Cubamyces menziesii]